MFTQRPERQQKAFDLPAPNLATIVDRFAVQTLHPPCHRGPRDNGDARLGSGEVQAGYNFGFLRDALHRKPRVLRISFCSSSENL
jgi:hypothetical protein